MKAIKLGPNESPLMPSASMAISSNGYGILRMPKYADKIAKTTIHRFRPGGCLVRMEWLDGDGKVVAAHTGEYDPERYPLLGEVVELDNPLSP